MPLERRIYKKFSTFTLLGDPPVKCRGANWEIWHGSLFTAGTAPTDGITLVALYSAWAAGMEDI